MKKMLLKLFAIFDRVTGWPVLVVPTNDTSFALFCAPKERKKAFELLFVSFSTASSSLTETSIFQGFGNIFLVL